MTSNDVNKAIRKIVRPKLTELGFESFGQRNFLKKTDGAICVINFQSFNEYLADQLGVTTYSFGINLGIYFPFLADLGEPRKPQQPREYECHFRKTLDKNIKQNECSRKDIWLVKNLNSLEAIIEDALRSIRKQGIPWFDKYGSFENAVRVIQTQDESDEIWGMGNFGSPIRNRFVEAVNKKLSGSE